MTTLTRARRATSARLRAAELPSCFAEATICSEAKVLATEPHRRTRGQRNDLRRLADKARRVSLDDMSTSDALAARGYSHVPTLAPGNGRRCVVRDGRIVMVGTCFDVNDWIRRLDRKVSAMRARGAA